MTKLTSLIEVSDSILCIIDVQDFFLARIEASAAKRLVERIQWLARVATWLDVPVVTTAEDIATSGPTVHAIREVLPPAVVDLDKHVFGLAGQKNIFEVVRATNRKTAVLCGLETDVCVQHSALGLLDHGYAVAVISDATATTGSGQDIGIGRMRQAGAAIVSCKSLLFEWLRNLEKSHDFFKRSGIETPGDIDL
jgi:nicotinamidase-related amidase